jgi:hypothetical protein
MDWKPIESAPIKPFDKEKWFMAHSPRVLVYGGYKFVDVATYNYTERGRGRWISDTMQRVISPSHWQPLPEPPKEPQQ